MASHTFVRSRGCPGWCRERKRAAVVFWILGSITRVWYRDGPFCVFLCFICLLSGGLQETDCLLYTPILLLPPVLTSAEIALVTQKACGIVALPMFAREVLCELRLMLCFGGDESNCVSLDDFVASWQLNWKR